MVLWFILPDFNFQWQYRRTVRAEFCFGNQQLKQCSPLIPLNKQKCGQWGHFHQLSDITAIWLLLCFHFLISWIALSLCIVITRSGDLNHKPLHRSVLENRRMKVNMEKNSVCVHTCVCICHVKMWRPGVGIAYFLCQTGLTFFILKWRFSLNLGAYNICQIRWAMSSKVCLSPLCCGHTDMYFSAWLLLSCWGCKLWSSCWYGKHLAHYAITPTPRICSFRHLKPWAGSLSRSVFHNWILYAICMSLLG